MKLKLIAGNANPKLAQEIAKKMGIELSPATIGRFSYGEWEGRIEWRKQVLRRRKSYRRIINFGLD